MIEIHNIIKLTRPRYQVISEVSRDIGQVFFASLFIGPLITGKINWLLVIMGFFLSIMFWLFGVLLIKD